MEQITKQRSDAGKKHKSYNVKSISYKSFIQGANRAGFKVYIKLEHYKIVLNSPCYFCGWNGSTNIDRLDCSDSYNEYNIISSCDKCKQLRQSVDINTFTEQVGKIAKHLISLNNQININKGEYESSFDRYKNDLSMDEA